MLADMLAADERLEWEQAVDAKKAEEEAVSEPVEQISEVPEVEEQE